eukprot:8660887-Pyramimonas_sp.AAC.1
MDSRLSTIRSGCKLSRRICAVTHREQHFEQETASILETVADVCDECARRQRESHISKAARPPS